MIPKYRAPEVRYAFYDLIAKVAPGMVTLLVALVATLGPSYFLKTLTDGRANHFFSATMLPFWFVASYFVGVILNQVWALLDAARKALRAALAGDRRPALRRGSADLTDSGGGVRPQSDTDRPAAETQAVRECLVAARHENDGVQLRYWLNRAIENLEWLPPPHRMLERLRYEPEGDADRFLKLRAEARMCEASAAGLAINTLYLLVLAPLIPLSQNLFRDLEFPYEQRVILAILLAVAAVVCIARSRRQWHKFYEGTCNAWLVRHAERELPRLLGGAIPPSQRAEPALEIRLGAEIRVTHYREALIGIPAIESGATEFAPKDLLASATSLDNLKYTLDQHLEDLYLHGRIRREDSLLVLGLRNVLVNFRGIAIVDGHEYAVKGESPRGSERPYYGLAIDNGRASLTCVLLRGEALENLPAYFVSGIPVLWDDSGPEELLDLILAETYDQSHIWEIPRGAHPAATDATRQAWKDLNRVFRHHCHSDLQTAAEAMREAEKRCAIPLIRNTGYLHSAIGVDALGRLVNVVGHGSLEDLGRRARTLGCARAIVVENSGSVMPTYVPGGVGGQEIPLLRAPNFRAAGRAVLVAVLEGAGFAVLPLSGDEGAFPRP